MATIEEFEQRMMRIETRITAGFNHLGIDTGAPRVEVMFVHNKIEVHISTLGVPISHIADALIANAFDKPAGAIPIIYNGAVIGTITREAMAQLRAARRHAINHGECNAKI